MSARYYGWYDGMDMDPEPIEEYEPEWDAWDEEEPDENFCPRCGKNYFDFSDYGCSYCDRRVGEDGLPNEVA